MQFQRATKARAKLRMALIGPAGSGKTYTALAIARAVGGPIAVLDTEHGSASKYAGLFDFDVLELDSFAPMTYVEAIRAAEAAGYAVLIVDSLSHAWIGKDGALDQVDRAAKRNTSGGGNRFGAWRDVTPQHNALVDAMIGARLHVIATMRTKMDYVQERDEKSGKTIVRKIGLQPVQRDGLEYEFDVVGDLTADNDLIIGKTRCPELTGLIVHRAGAEVAETLRAWLDDGPVPVAVPPAGDPPIEEVADKFWAAYAEDLGGRSWAHLEALLGPTEEPETVAAWRELARLVKAALRRQEYAATA